MKNIVVIAHDMRSTHNIGSLFRTAEAMGVTKLYLTGYTAYPRLANDSRLPHIYEKLDKQIEKTALGATKNVNWKYREDIYSVISDLRLQGYEIAALEQSNKSFMLDSYTSPQKIAIVLGTEVTGLTSEIIDKVDKTLEIKMFGKKESLNVVQAAAMALFQLRFY